MSNENNLIERHHSCKECQTTYLDDIVINNASYLVPNESVQSSQPKRKAEGGFMGSLHTYKGSDGEGRGKKIFKFPMYTSNDHHQDNWRGRSIELPTFLAGPICWRTFLQYLNTL